MCNGWLMLNMSKRTCVVTEGFAKTDHTQNSNAPVYCIRLPYHTSAFTCWAEACGSFWKTSYFLYPCGFHTFLCQLVRKLRYGFGLTWTSFPFLYYWFFSAKVKDKCHIWIVLPLTFSIFFFSWARGSRDRRIFPHCTLCPSYRHHHTILSLFRYQGEKIYLN